MSAIEFEPWPKIARLNRDITITEKIDGTNAAIVIKDESTVDFIGYEDGTRRLFEPDASRLIARVASDDGRVFLVFAQSRSRFITPGKATDNYGFAGWVETHAPALVETLGEGTHFGEWWGSGIQRGYGLKGGDKRFSLFNTRRWFETLGFDEDKTAIPGLRRVPVLVGDGANKFSDENIEFALNELRTKGSAASGNGAEAEGIVVFHHASREMYKVTLKGDDAPKGADGHKGDGVNA